MNTTLLRTTLAGLALTAVAMTSVVAPARADGASTTRTIIGVAAAVAGIATAVNVEHKHAVANQVVGYLSDGSTVYADGHVVSPNGQSWYPGNQGQQIACNGQSCSVYQNGQYTGYNNGGYNPYNNGGYYNNGYNNGSYNNGGYTPYNNGSYNNGSYNNGGYYYNGQYYPQSRERRRPPQ